jgi:hypothetical protein
MLFERLRERLSAGMGFVEPCLPSPAVRCLKKEPWGTQGSFRSKRRLTGVVLPEQIAGQYEPP